MTKKQRDMLAKVFRILRAGVEEAERAAQHGTAEDVLTHVRTMNELTAKMVTGLEGHIGAVPLLLHVAEKRPHARGPIGRPKASRPPTKLSLVKG